jgi:hypothetical protein
VRVAANASVLNPETVPTATRASDNARENENLALMKNPFWGEKTLKKRPIDPISHKNLP